MGIHKFEYLSPNLIIFYTDIKKSRNKIVVSFSKNDKVISSGDWIKDKYVFMPSGLTIEFSNIRTLILDKYRLYGGDDGSRDLDSSEPIIDIYNGIDHLEWRELHNKVYNEKGFYIRENIQFGQLKKLKGFLDSFNEMQNTRDTARHVSMLDKEFPLNPNVESHIASFLTGENKSTKNQLKTLKNKLYTYKTSTRRSKQRMRKLK
jgi:hypothetical protein